MDRVVFKNECLRSPRLTTLFGNFSKIASGEVGFPKKKFPIPNDEYIKSDQRLANFFACHKKMWGRFDPHFFASIPCMLEEECRIGASLLSYGLRYTSSVMNVYTIGTAEATMARTLGVLGNGRVRTLSCSPNIENRESFFSHGTPIHSFFHLGGFFEIDEKYIENSPQFVGGFDVVIEDTTFQMYGPNRKEQIGYVSRVLKDDGILMLIEKMRDDDMGAYQQKERIKDRFKAQHFTDDQIEDKREILTVMEKNQVTLNDTICSMLSIFKYTMVFWNSCNFYGVAGSNSKSSLMRFIASMPPPYCPAEYCHMQLPVYFNN